jgi:hypothetical protein
LQYVLGTGIQDIPEVQQFWMGFNIGFPIAMSFMPAGGAVAAEGITAGRTVTASERAIAAEFGEAEGIVAQNGTWVNGFTSHGIDRAIGDAAQRAGTKPQAILDAIKNPLKIESGVNVQGLPFQKFTGQNAAVIVNPQTGKVVSVWPLSGAGAH